MIRVKATREGLPGQKTSTGYRVDSLAPFVALPAAAVLRQWILVRNPTNGLSCRALVLDEGPWNVNDNAYVFQPLTEPGSGDLHPNPTMSEGVRPQSESGLDVSHNGHTNGAGIDLGERVRTLLGITDDNLEVEWEFAP